MATMTVKTPANLKESFQKLAQESPAMQSLKAELRARYIKNALDNPLKMKRMFAILANEQKQYDNAEKNFLRINEKVMSDLEKDLLAIKFGSKKQKNKI